MIQIKSVLCFLLMPLCKTCGFLGPSSRWNGPFPENVSIQQSTTRQERYAHATVISPFDPYLQVKSQCFDLGGLFRVEQQKSEQTVVATEQRWDDIQKLCRQLRATPVDLLRLETSPDGVRGVYLNRSIQKGDVILSLPLDSCLQDDCPPSWLQPQTEDEEREDDDGSLSSCYNPSGWATRLAASLLDLRLKHLQTNDNISDGQSLWFSLLPNPEYLRASLPVHWPDETVQSARSTALELAVDSSYFARAEAVEDLLIALNKNSGWTKDWKTDQLREMCHEALDLVQTRSCRLIRNDHDIPLRVLAPIFDFLNHGSMKISGEGGANAQFQLEDNTHLVVRAIRDCKIDEEVLIDYGESSRPAWRCLLSYGFVPQYNRIPGPHEGATAESDAEDNVAEVYMDGIRYEVGPSQIPFDMVASAFRSDHPVDDDEDSVALTPEVALKLATRISDWAYHLLLEPEDDLYDDHPAATPTPFQVISSRAAASLRWSQHRVLTACALGLREFAADQTSYM